MPKHRSGYKQRRAVPYTTNKTSKFKVGERVRFLRPDGIVMEDTVRWCFWQITQCQPYGDDLIYPALVLTDHAWCAESDVCAASEATDALIIEAIRRERLGEY